MVVCFYILHWGCVEKICLLYMSMMAQQQWDRKNLFLIISNFCISICFHQSRMVDVTHQVCSTFCNCITYHCCGHVTPPTGKCCDLPVCSICKFAYCNEDAPYCCCNHISSFTKPRISLPHATVLEKGSKLTRCADSGYKKLCDAPDAGPKKVGHCSTRTKTAWWKGLITFNKIMMFYGILLKIVLHPVPGQI